jgi:hypothetical protein
MQKNSQPHAKKLTVFFEKLTVFFEKLTVFFEKLTVFFPPRKHWDRFFWRDPPQSHG